MVKSHKGHGIGSQVNVSRFLWLSICYVPVATFQI